MKISEMVRLMTSVWFKEFASPLTDADIFKPFYPQITGDTEITDSYYNNMFVKKDEDNIHVIEIHCGRLFSIKLCFNAFPFAYAPPSLFMDIIYVELLKMGWVKSVCATLILNCDGKGAKGLAPNRRYKFELLIAKAVYDGIPEMLSNILNTDWHKLSYDFQSGTHTFMRNGIDFQVYGEMSNDWIKDFVTESFEAMIKDCQLRNHIECAAVLLDWKKKNIPEDKEEIGL